MMAHPDAVAALGRIPGWDAADCRITELTGGLSNRVYHVHSADGECVVRLDARGGYRPDRRLEAKIMTAAAEAGLAPAVLYADPDAGILVTEYLHGRVWQRAELQAHENLEALAALLRRVHSLPACGNTIDLTRFAEGYAGNIGTGHEARSTALHCIRIVRERPAAGKTA